MKTEQEILQFWKHDKSFEKSLNPLHPVYTYYDGPPFATGLPHYGHLLASFIKDTIPRFKTQQGYYVKRQWGWDTHGLPVEHEIDKQYGFKTMSDILEFGIKNYNTACRNIVLKYRQEWHSTIERIGRWVDMDKDYKTMDLEYMEKVWYYFKQLFEKGFVYTGYKVMPYSPSIGTALSKNEAESNYKNVLDPSLVVKFPLVDDPKTFLLVWTTTPWTLTTNLALCVSLDINYSKVTQGDETYIVATDKVSSYFKVKADSTFSGHELVGKKYQYLWSTYPGQGTVIEDGFVKTDKGTGIVHLSPSYGVEDNEICVRKGLIANDKLVDVLDAHGHFVSKDFCGMYFKDADVVIIKELKQRGLCFSSKKEKHDYRFCWRSDTPLIFKPVYSIFLAVNKVRERLQVLNQSANWYPSHIKNGRFGKWLENTVDWCIGRSRVWGTPIPMFTNGNETVVVGSIKELEELTGTKVHDLHRESVDHLIVNSNMKRVDFVFDCWFESGLMPFCSADKPLPTADFIAEGLDQTRGWFYSLLVLSTMLKDEISFKNVMVNGLVLAEDGQKMAKQKKNYPDPNIMLDKYGSDVIRLYLLESPVTIAENIKFEETGLTIVSKRLSTVKNCIKYLTDNDFFTTFNLQDFNTLSDLSILDKWILNNLYSCQHQMHNSLDQFSLATAVRTLYSFIDNLSNWYLKLSKHYPNQIVFAYCLYNLSIMSAPLIPFTSEMIYSHFTNTSVHCHLYKNINLTQYKDIDAGMSAFINVVEHVREHRKYPAKLALSSVTVHTKANLQHEQLLLLVPILQKELNTTVLTIVPDFDTHVKVEYKPNKATIGKTFKNLALKILKSLDDKTCYPDMTVVIDDKTVTLSENCFNTTLLAMGTILKEVCVELDQTVTEQAVTKYWKSILERLVQETRKKAGLKPKQLATASFIFEMNDLGQELNRLCPTNDPIDYKFQHTYVVNVYNDKEKTTSVTVYLGF